MPRQKKVVISRNSLPRKAPVKSTILYAIALDYFHAPDILWIAFIALMALEWFFWFTYILTFEEVDHVITPEFKFKKSYAQAMVDAAFPAKEDRI